MEIFERLRRIEMQQNAIWYDMAMWAMTVIMVIALFTATTYIKFAVILAYFIMIVIIQICEKREFQKIEKYYGATVIEKKTKDK